MEMKPTVFIMFLCWHKLVAPKYA